MKVDTIDRSHELATQGVAMLDKPTATLQAIAARAGVRVDPIEADDGRLVYIISRWALTKQCNTLDELRNLLRRMGIAAE